MDETTGKQTELSGYELDTQRVNGECKKLCPNRDHAEHVAQCYQNCQQWGQRWSREKP